MDLGHNSETTRRRPRRNLLSVLMQAAGATALFSLIFPAVIVVSVMAYARFILHKSVELEWNMLGVFDDPLGLAACGVFFLTVFAWRIRR